MDELDFITSGQTAGFAVIELMKRTKNRIATMAAVDAYAEALQAGENTNDVFWNAFGGKPQKQSPKTAASWRCSGTVGGSKAIRMMSRTAK